MELVIMGRTVQFLLAAQLSGQNYQTLAHHRLELPVELDQQANIAKLPCIDEKALLSARLSCDGLPVRLLRVAIDNLSGGEFGPAHGLVLLEGDIGTLHLSIMRVDNNPSIFLVTAATWYSAFRLASL
jgi:hypothetical protein